MVGLATVTVDKDELLKKLTANRREHKRTYSEAIKGYRAAAITRLKKMHDDAVGGRDFDTAIALAVPQDHSEEYDTAIEMVTMSVRKEIELTAQEFSQYIRDEWGWKQQFTHTSSMYVG